MLKKIAFVALLALQFAAVCGVATADLPFPKCGPCPPRPTGVRSTVASQQLIP